MELQASTKIIWVPYRGNETGINKHKANISSPMDPLQRMAAVRIRVQTANKNITIIHKQSTVHQLTSCEVKSCVLVIYSSIIIAFLISIHCFWLKYESSIHNIFSCEKVISSQLNQKRNIHILSTVYNWNSSKTNMSVDFDVRGQHVRLFTFSHFADALIQCDLQLGSVIHK